MFTAHTTKTANGFKATLIKTSPCPVRGNMLVNAFHLPELYTTRYEATKAAKAAATRSTNTQRFMAQYRIDQVLKGI